jgi:hypothetical protein
MVFDPGLFDGPVLVQEWAQIIHASPDCLKVTPFRSDNVEEYIPKKYRWGEGKIKDINRHATERMEKYIKEQKEGLRAVFASSAAQQAAQWGIAEVSEGGQTWQGLYLNVINKKSRPLLGGLSCFL